MLFTEENIRNLMWRLALQDEPERLITGIERNRKKFNPISYEVVESGTYRPIYWLWHSPNIENYMKICDGRHFTISRVPHEILDWDI